MSARVSWLKLHDPRVVVMGKPARDLGPPVFPRSLRACRSVVVISFVCFARKNSSVRHCLAAPPVISPRCSAAVRGGKGGSGPKAPGVITDPAIHERVLPEPRITARCRRALAGRHGIPAPRPRQQEFLVLIEKLAEHIERVGLPAPGSLQPPAGHKTASLIRASRFVVWPGHCPPWLRPSRPLPRRRHLARQVDSSLSLAATAFSLPDRPRPPAAAAHHRNNVGALGSHRRARAQCRSHSQQIWAGETILESVRSPSSQRR